MVMGMAPTSRPKLGSRHVGTLALPPLSVLAWRTAVLAVAAVVALAVGRQSLAVQARRASPEAALRLGSNPENRLRAAMLKGLQTPKRLADPQIARDVRAVLARQPLDAPSLRMLALNAQQRGRPVEARKYALLAQSVTRRETLTQLILAEDAARAANPRGALRHIDMALRGTDQGRTVLFGVLNKAMADPRIRGEMALYVTGGAPWLPDFLDYSVRDGAVGAANTARLLIAAHAERQPGLIKPIEPLLLGALVDQREFALARGIRGLTRRGQADLTGTAAMTRATFDRQAGPFSWEPLEGAASGASVTYAKSGQASVSAFASSGEKDVVLRRTLQLSHGLYRLFERRTAISGDATARMRWRLSCLGKTVTQIWQGPEQPLAYQAGGTAGPTIPAGCPAQLLELSATGGSGPDGVEVTIGGFDLRR